MGWLTTICGAPALSQERCQPVRDTGVAPHPGSEAGTTSPTFPLGKRGLESLSNLPKVIAQAVNAVSNCGLRDSEAPLCPFLPLQLNLSPTNEAAGTQEGLTVNTPSAR